MSLAAGILVAGAPVRWAAANPRSVAPPAPSRRLSWSAAAADGGGGGGGGGEASKGGARRRKKNIQGSKARRSQQSGKRETGSAGGEYIPQGPPPAPESGGGGGADPVVSFSVGGMGGGPGGGMGTVSDLPGMSGVSSSYKPREPQPPVVDLNLQGFRPPAKDGEVQQPEWVTLLEEEAKNDPDLAELLKGADGDPQKIEDRARARLEAANLKIFDESEGGYGGGVQAPMRVAFREYDQFNLWLWWELQTVPTDRERNLLEDVVQAWFLVGKLGGYNALNMQVMNAGIELAEFDYDLEEAENALPALFHNMGDLEESEEGNWVRCWFDLGTSDQFALDVLVNSLHQLSRDYVGIKQFVIGGNKGGDGNSWEVPDQEQMADSIMYQRDMRDD